MSRGTLEFNSRDMYRSFMPPEVVEAVQLRFPDIIHRDVYNLTQPFLVDGSRYLAARVEPRENHDSRVYLFRPGTRADEWWIEPRWTPMVLEDPFCFSLRGTLHLGGVQTFPDSRGIIESWRTVVYDISAIDAPKLVFAGPKGMKDLRFLEYTAGSIGVFTRPQGDEAGRGSIGYLEVGGLEDLTDDGILAAPLISQPEADSWEGVNQPILLESGEVLLLGHVAWMEQGGIRHYHGAACRFNPRTQKKEPWNLICTREMLPPGPAKRPDLTDVLFPGGLGLTADKNLELYLGVSDAQAWRLVIPSLPGLFD
ncbi:DUF1861 family protein [Spirochaeta lutea]|uniref:Glycosidase n=1 Tax=Spirochaeta lutea TaxID=1480694 RepID=A0A098QT14_9SPIO|nr:DUF1861 family protein [Spirochaeta lutea]KGE70809.1 hypothetical protein DC28_15090 [Spirochaeta lutea]